MGLQRALLVTALLLAGCPQLKDEIREEFLPDKGMRLFAPSPLVVGEHELAYAYDACTSLDNAEECEDDTWLVTKRTIEGAVTSTGGSGAQVQLVAGLEPGMATLEVEAQLVGAPASTPASEKAVIEVRAPDEARLRIECANQTHDTMPVPTPYLVPASSELVLAWSLILASDGKPRSGDTGMVMTEAPGLALLEKLAGMPRARFRAPATGLVTARSTLGSSSVEIATYPAAEAVLELMPSPLGSLVDDAIDVFIYSTHGGVRTCNAPGRKLIVSETPDVCVFKEFASDPAVESVTTSATRVAVIALRAGTCQIAVSIEGTAIASSFDIDVVPR